MLHRFNYSLSLVLLLIIAYLTIWYTPAPDNELSEIPYMDKIVHFLMFFGLSWAVAFDYTRHWLLGRSSVKTMLLLSILISSLYGGAIEWIQGTFTDNRCADINDWYADTLGAIVGALVYIFFFRKLTIRIFSHFHASSGDATKKNY